MKDQDKTKEQLISELERLRRENAELKTLKAGHAGPEKLLVQKEHQTQNKILDALIEHVVYQDMEMKVLWANRAACRSVDLDLEQVVGRHCYEIWAQRSAPCDDCPVKLSRETGQQQSKEKKTPDGRYWHIKASPVFDANGQIVAMVELTLNISEHKRMEDALKKSEVRHRSLVETIPHGIQEIDTKGTITFVNPAHNKIYGYSYQEMIGKSILDLQTSDSAKTELNAYLAKLVEEQPEPTPYIGKNCTKDARVIDVQVDWNYKRDDQGRVVGFISVLTDITEKNRATEALQKAHDKLEHRVQKRTAELLAANQRLIMEAEKRKITQDVLKASQAELNTIFDHTPVATLIIDQEHRVRKANLSAMALASRSEEEMVSRRDGEALGCLHAFDDSNGCGFGLFCKTCKFRLTVLETLQSGKAIHEIEATLPIAHEKGPQELHLLVSTAPILGYDMMCVCINDITERKKTEAALRESKEKYSMIFENIQDVYYEVTLDGIILEISPSIKEVSKYSREELIGTSAYNLYAYPKKRDEFVRELLKKGNVSDYEIILKDKDGSQGYCSIYAKFSNGKNGVPEKIIGSIRDVTQRKQMENALRESEAQKTALLDAAIDRIRYVDTDMKIIWANKTAVDASGMAPEDLVGKTCYQLFVGRNTPCEGCPTLKSKKTGRIERKVMHQPKAKGISGESYWDTYCVPLKNEAGNSESFIQIARNITEQIRAKEQIHDLTHDLMNAQESERQMISRELHDSVAQELATIKINCETLFNHQSAVHPEIRQRISEMSKTLQKSIEIVRNLSYDLRPPALDELGLVQALFQYCDDFSEDNGINVDFHSAGMKDLKLDFDTEINLYRLIQEGLTNIKKHAGADHVTIRLVAAFPNIILRIKDNGRGFNVQERLANITKEKRMGIRSIEERVKLLQGEMEIQSRPMQGTKISIKLPYKDKKSGS